MINLELIKLLLGGEQYFEKMIDDSIDCDCAALALLVCIVGGAFNDDRSEFRADGLVERLLDSHDPDLLAGLLELAYALGREDAVIPDVSRVEGRLSSVNQAFMFYMRAYCLMVYERYPSKIDIVDALEKSSQEGLVTAEFILNRLGYPNIVGYSRIVRVASRKVALLFRLVIGPRRTLGWTDSFWRLPVWLDEGAIRIKIRRGLESEQSWCCRATYDRMIRYGMFTECFSEYSSLKKRT
ncbi:hypothetical protein J2T60_001317 [Natronospira proteinivora]|uniref:Uncharacterized protein n=1 Tax=Natronospira proteinivora TaxID=1807133 RepID=A0ABT1G7S0_9GAMM|nr:hypothetical protein [Natronospira proteinivora]MCP1727352.1 hypothetical protein [Natronospira proteinivora]